MLNTLFFFADQLLGSEASRLAEELTNLSLETSITLDKLTNSAIDSFNINSSQDNGTNSDSKRSGVDPIGRERNNSTDQETFTDCVDFAEEATVNSMSSGSRVQQARRSLNLEGGNERQSNGDEDPFKVSSRISRSPPPIGARRPVSVGAAADPFMPNRTLARDDDGVSCLD